MGKSWNLPPWREAGLGHLCPQGAGDNATTPAVPSPQPPGLCFPSWVGLIWVYLGCFSFCYLPAWLGRRPLHSGFGWEPQIPSPWRGQPPKMPPWERGSPSLSLFFLLFFFFISTFIFPSLGVAQLNRRLLSLCPPWAHRRQLPAPCSDCNSSRLFRKTPQNPPILAPAGWCAAGGVGVSTGTRR